MGRGTESQARTNEFCGASLREGRVWGGRVWGGRVQPLSQCPHHPLSLEARLRVGRA